MHYLGPLVAPTETSWFLHAFNILWSYVIHRDGDGVPDGFDNCIDLPNGEQADVDDDNIGMKF